MNIEQWGVSCFCVLLTANWFKTRKLFLYRPMLNVKTSITDWWWCRIKMHGNVSLFMFHKPFTVHLEWNHIGISLGCLPFIRSISITMMLNETGMPIWIHIFKSMEDFFFFVQSILCKIIINCTKQRTVIIHFECVHASIYRFSLYNNARFVVKIM